MNKALWVITPTGSCLVTAFTLEGASSTIFGSMDQVVLTAKCTDGAGAVIAAIPTKVKDESLAKIIEKAIEKIGTIRDKMNNFVASGDFDKPLDLRQDITELDAMLSTNESSESSE